MDQADIAQHLHPHFVMQTQGHYPVTEGWYFSPFTEDGDNPSFQVRP